MTRAQDLANQMDALVHELQQELANPTPEETVISTVDALNLASAKGGTYRLVATGGDNGKYKGNFVFSKPIKLTAETGATLTPGDIFTPTVQVKSGQTSFTKLGIENGAPDRECVVVGDFNATSADAQPDGVLFDTCVIAAGPKGGKRGLVLHGKNLSAINTRITNFWCAQEGQGIWIHNGPGPYRVEGCYIEGSGENIMAGGEHIHIPNCVPTDITIRGNTCFKPDTWRTNGALVKNLFELKNARKVLVDNNVFDGCWRSGQAGTPIMLTPRNQYGDTPWVVVDDVIFKNNIVRRAAEVGAVSILGSDNNFPSQQTRSLTFEHNLFVDCPYGFLIGNGVTLALIIRNNTLPAIKNSFLQFNDSRADGTPNPPTKSPITFTENIVKAGEYGISGTNQTVGKPALDYYTTTVEWRGNVIEKSAQRPWIAFPNPETNFLLEVGGLAKILDPTTFKLLPGTPYGTAGY